MLLNMVHRPPQFMADYAPGRPARLHRHVIWLHCEMRICMSTASMISLRRLKFASNGYSETPAIPFINAQFQPAVFPWRKDASASCYARSCELQGKRFRLPDFWDQRDENLPITSRSRHPRREPVP